jgi:hypothetical protein
MTIKILKIRPHISKFWMFKKISKELFDVNFENNGKSLVTTLWLDEDDRRLSKENLGTRIINDIKRRIDLKTNQSNFIDNLKSMEGHEYE